MAVRVSLARDPIAAVDVGPERQFLSVAEVTAGLYDAGLNAQVVTAEQLAATGANSVTFGVTWYQSSISSSIVFATPSTATDASLIHAMQVARITIRSPQSNQTYRGTITVQASAANAASVAYAVDTGAPVVMTFNSTTRVWQASLNTTTLTNGNGHAVDVINRGTSGATAIDRAWSVNIVN